MRHHSKTKKFNRTRKARVGLIKSLAVAFFEHDRITTTGAKAVALRPYVERLITEAKKGTVASTRNIIGKIGDNKSSQRLIKETVKGFKDRNGGYTRIIKIPKRAKDASPMAIIELVK